MGISQTGRTCLLLQVQDHLCGLCSPWGGRCRHVRRGLDFNFVTLVYELWTLHTPGSKHTCRKNRCNPGVRDFVWVESDQRNWMEIIHILLILTINLQNVPINEHHTYMKSKISAGSWLQRRNFSSDGTSGCPERWCSFPWMMLIPPPSCSTDVLPLNGVL